MRTLVACLLVVSCGQEVLMPTDRPVVESFTPEGRVDKTQPIEVRFDRPIVPPEAVGPVEGRPLLAISPPLPGRHRYLDRHTIQFVPDQSFAASTRYRVRILEPAVAGERTFHTPMFGLASVETFFDATPRGVSARVNVELTHPVSPAAATATITF